MSRSILFLTGSPTDEFHAELSRLYATDCYARVREMPGLDFSFVYFFTDGLACFPETLAKECIERARKYRLAEALALIERMQPSVAVPQMFCFAGMTSYRAAVELLGIPVVGNDGFTMALTADKVKTRAVATAAGIPVPNGTQLSDSHFSDSHSMSDWQPAQTGQTDASLDLLKARFPVVVKPATADNSHGVSLVHSDDELPSAIEEARCYSSQVIIEEYIPLGREVRCGTLVRNGCVECLPLQEYNLDTSSPSIRDVASKLVRQADGTLDLASKHQATSRFIAVDDPLTESVHRIARQCHHAFGCRDYGLFDFRIDPHNNVFLLEAGLYCSFAPKSIVVGMATAAGIPLTDLFSHCISLAAARDARGQRVREQQTVMNANLA